MLCYRSAVREIRGLVSSHRAVLLLVVVVFTLAETVVPAQAPSTSPLPKDPKALLELSAQTNGLSGELSHPWHLVANITSFDEKETAIDHGTYEEFWAGPRRYKIVYSAGTFSQTAIRTDQGLVLFGSTGAPPEFLALDNSELFTPIPTALPIVNPSTDKVELTHLKTGNVQLDCLNLRFHQTSFGDLSGPSYCLSSNSSILRGVINAGGLSQTLFNQIEFFDGRFVAQSIVNIWNQKKRFEIQVVRLEALKNANSVEETPSAVSLQIPETFAITAHGGSNILIKKVPPNYPLSAKQNRVQGTVVLRVVIDKAGQLENVQAVSGPEALVLAAIDAVRQWRYKPFFLYGEPFKVDTTINVIFTLG